jgi:hypothetical protein
MMLTGETRNTRRKPCPSATLSTTNLTCTDLGLNLSLRSESLVNIRLCHGTAS